MEVLQKFKEQAWTIAENVEIARLLSTMATAKQGS